MVKACLILMTAMVGVMCMGFVAMLGQRYDLFPDPPAVGTNAVERAEYMRIKGELITLQIEKRRRTEQQKAANANIASFTNALSVASTNLAMVQDVLLRYGVLREGVQ